MVNSIGFSNNFYSQQKQNLINERYNDIYKHERAHKQAAGSLGGSIVVEKDSNGIPTSGHVDIQMPGLNEENPDQTIKDANTVINAAMAPDDPSAQDYKVASEAKSIRYEAENQKSKLSENNSSYVSNPQVGQKINYTA